MRRLAVVSLLVALLTGWGFGQTTSGKASGMTAQQLGRLRASKRRFVVPTYVPAGLKVKNFQLMNPRNPLLLSWVLTYEHPKSNASLILQMCSEGIGDVFFTLGNGVTVEATGHKEVRSKVLGNVSVEEYVKGRHRLWHVNWVEIGPKAVPRFVALIGEKISPVEGRKIVAGLRWLK
jgi:hypothetical protein